MQPSAARPLLPDDAMDRRPQHPTRCRATALTAFTGPSRARASAPMAVNGRLERVKGIEPSSSAWKAVALPLSYTRTCSIFRGQQRQVALLLILNRGRRIKLGASQRNGYSPLLTLYPRGDLGSSVVAYAGPHQQASYRCGPVGGLSAAPYGLGGGRAMRSHRCGARQPLRGIELRLPHEVQAKRQREMDARRPSRAQGRAKQGRANREAPSQRHAPQPQGVADDAHRRERHCGRGNDGRQQHTEEGEEHTSGDRHADRIVDEGEEEVLANIGHRRRR